MRKTNGSSRPSTVGASASTAVTGVARLLAVGESARPSALMASSWMGGGWPDGLAGTMRFRGSQSTLRANAAGPEDGASVDGAVTGSGRNGPAAAVSAPGSHSTLRANAAGAEERGGGNRRDSKSMNGAVA